MNLTADDSAVLITGGTGFIGSHLAGALLRQGSNVYVLSSGRQESRAIWKGNNKGKLRIFHCPIQNYRRLRRIVTDIKPRKVYHLAAVVGDDCSLRFGKRCVETNVIGTLNLLRALQSTDYEVFVHVGTCEIYSGTHLPFSENDPIYPSSLYGITKASSELLCHWMFHVHGAPTICLRLGHVYGPNQDARKLIPYVIVSCLTDISPKIMSGERTRDLIYVDDVTDGIIRASQTSKCIGKVMNLAGGREYTIREIVDTIVRLTRPSFKTHFVTHPAQKHEVQRMWCSIERARKLLRWKPRTTLEEGLRKTIQWYREHQKLWRR